MPEARTVSLYYFQISNFSDFYIHCLKCNISNQSERIASQIYGTDKDCQHFQITLLNDFFYLMIYIRDIDTLIHILPFRSLQKNDRPSILPMKGT